MYTYTIDHMGYKRTVKVPFYPYENEINDLNENLDWVLEGINKIELDMSHPIVSTKSIYIDGMRGEGKVSISRDITLEPNTDYFISLYVRNDGVTTSTLEINDVVKRSSIEKFVTRLYSSVRTDDTGKVNIKVGLYDKMGKHTAWLDGFMAVKLPDELIGKKDYEIIDYYDFVPDKKESPAGTDLLREALSGSPYLYGIVKDNIKMPNINRQLHTRGINPGDEVHIVSEPHEVAINMAMSSDIVLMAMLEGDTDRVSHAFPKQDSKMANLDAHHFPRIQFYSGDGVGKIIADGRPFAEMTNFAMNYYIPITKVLPSVNAIMMGTQASAIMAELGWSKVRGSDYFMTQEQLYILQSQFIKDTTVKRRRK